MKNLLLLITVVVALHACSPAPEEMYSTANGKYTYTFLKDSAGQEAAQGDYFVVDFKIVDSNDSTWMDRNQLPIEKDSNIWKTERGEFWSILKEATSGDSIRATISVNEFLQIPDSLPLPPAYREITEFNMHVKVTEVTDYNTLAERRQREQEDRMKSLMGEEYVSPEDQLKMDQETIENYLTENGIEAEQIESGMYVQIKEAGEGDNAKSNDTVYVNYTGYTLEGKVFDTSLQSVAEENEVYNPQRTYEPLTFTIDNYPVIQGWHNGFKHLNTGAKATLYIPSTLAYGRQGSPPVISPNAVLAFDVELVEIK